MIHRNPSVETRLQFVRTVTRWSAFMVLANCCLTVDTIMADLITVTSVSDSVEIKDTTVPFIQTDNGSNLSGNFLNEIFGSGNSQTDGYRSQQNTTTTSSSINVFWRVDIPSPGSLQPDAWGKGNSEILFTAMSYSQYTAVGDNQFGLGTIDTLFTYKLRDLTAAVDLVEFTDGWDINGNQVNSTIGSLTGNLIAGRQYSWTSDYIAAKYGAENNQLFTATGNASLMVSSVPEPTSAALLGIAGLGLFFRRRRR